LVDPAPQVNDFQSGATANLHILMDLGHGNRNTFNRFLFPTTFTFTKDRKLLGALLGAIAITG
jgi:hypothetical protein